MKIIFLCGSLEPGRDGVGDYTRQLASELILNGHQAGIVAINDQHIKDRFEGVQNLGNVSLQVLRLPSHISSLHRFKLAALWIDNLDPEWLSLQFVPFAFHPKGLPFQMGKLLTTLTGRRRWHIMVHELWVGMNKESSLKFFWWGLFQRQLIKSLFNKLMPAVIHTQTKLYLNLLEKMGFKSQLLPLFSNISVAEDISIIRANDDDKIISFVVFGGIHPGAPIDKLAKELKHYSNQNAVKIVLKLLGRSGAEQLRWEQEWQAAGLCIELIGEQPEEQISAVLSNSSFGISTTPPSLIEKSGSVAAMREHGMSILCLSRPWHPRDINEPQLSPGVTEYQEGKIQDFIAQKNEAYPSNNKTGISHQFINDLLSS
jgi:hypothetical protein